jgi:hypothetical protein
MLTYLSFFQVFFSNQFTEYIDIKDLSNYRCICKKTRDMRINLKINPSIFTRLQLKKVIPNNTESHLIKNTYLEMKYDDVNRYSELFSSINIHYDMCLYIDSQYEKDIDDKQKQKLINFKKKHYICLNFYMKKDDTYFEYVLCFQSQREVLIVVQKIVNNITRYYFLTKDELYTVFKYVVESFYSGYFFYKQYTEKYSLIR